MILMWCSPAVSSKHLAIHDKRLNNQYTRLFPWKTLRYFVVSIDFSNSNLTVVPMGLILLDKTLTSLNLNGNPLVALHESISKLGIQEILNFLKKDISKNEVEYPFLKLMVVGEAAAGLFIQIYTHISTKSFFFSSGKTTLILRLNKPNIDGDFILKQRIMSTDGIDLGDLKIGDTTYTCYDFAGMTTSSLLLDV